MSLRKASTAAAIILALSIVCPAKAETSFYRGINFGGAAVTIDGNQWQSNAAALSSGLSLGSASTWKSSYNFSFQPAADAGTAEMLQSGVWAKANGNGGGFTLSQEVPGGTYDVYLWALENYRSYYRNMTVRVEGAVVGDRIGNLMLGEWKRYGPYRTAVQDGALTVDVLRNGKGDPMLVGMALYSVTEATPLNRAPAVSLTSPATGAVFNSPATITLSASASDADGSVSKVDFYEGSTLLGSSTNSPYSYNWTGVAGGSYTITARATDNAGNTSISSPVTLTVAAQAPVFYRGINLGGAATTVEGKQWLSHASALASGFSTNGHIWSGAYGFPLSPAAEAGVSAVLTSAAWTEGHSDSAGFTMSQQVPNGTYDVYLWLVENYQSYYRLVSVRMEGNSVASGIGGLPLGAWLKYGPYRATVQDGALSIDVTRNGKGDPAVAGIALYALSAQASASLPAANKPPAVAISSPSSGTSLTAPASVTLSASASDSDGSISRVDYYQGSTFIGSSALSPYTVSWTSIPAGSYSITARATDNAGATTTSAPVAITVGAARTSSDSTQPPAGALNVRNYGAQGNGSTNDSGAIQSAVNACPSGGAVYFPAGTYIVSGSIELRAHCTYTGDRARSILRQTTPGSFIFRKTASDPTGIALTNLVFDGGGVKIDWQAYSLTYQYNVMKNLTGTYGLYLPGGADGAIIDRNIFLNSPQGHYITSTNQFSNVKVTNNYFDTFYQGLESVGPTSTNVLVDSNTFLGASRMAVELMQHINYLTVTNNYLAAWRNVGAPLNTACDGRNGFECDSFALSIANGEPYVQIAYNKAYGTPGTSWGLELTVAMPGSSVHDNVLYNWSRDIVDDYSDPAVRPAIVNNTSCGGFADRNQQAHLKWPASNVYYDSCSGLPVAPVPAMPFDPNTGS